MGVSGKAGYSDTWPLGLKLFYLLEFQIFLYKKERICSSLAKLS